MTYLAFGKQVKRGDQHVSDAIDNATANKIAAALNFITHYLPAKDANK